MLPLTKSQNQNACLRNYYTEIFFGRNSSGREVGLDSVTSKGGIHGRGSILSGAAGELFGIPDVFPDGIMYCEASQKYILLTSKTAYLDLSTLNT